MCSQIRISDRWIHCLLSKPRVSLGTTKGFLLESQRHQQNWEPLNRHLQCVNHHVLISSWSTIQIFKDPKLSSNVTLLLTLEKATLQPGQTVNSMSLLKCDLFFDEVSTSAILSNLMLSWIFLCRWWFPSLSTREVESGQADLTGLLVQHWAYKCCSHKQHKTVHKLLYISIF